MTEEEKEAIEEFKREYNDGRILKSDIIIELNTARIVIDLIDKLQKELEQEKENAKKEHSNWKELLHEYGIKCEELEQEKDNFVHKDKIRELRAIDNIDYLQFKLKELLGE